MGNLKLAIDLIQIGWNYSIFKPILSRFTLLGAFFKRTPQLEPAASVSHINNYQFTFMDNYLKSLTFSQWLFKSFISDRGHYETLNVFPQAVNIAKIMKNKGVFNALNFSTAQSNPAAIDALVLLKKNGILTEDIETAINHHFYNAAPMLMAKSMIYLSKAGILTTQNIIDMDERCSGSGDLGRLYTVHEALKQLSEAKILDKQNFETLMAMSKDEFDHLRVSADFNSIDTVVEISNSGSIVKLYNPDDRERNIGILGQFGFFSHPSATIAAPITPDSSLSDNPPDSHKKS